MYGKEDLDTRCLAFFQELYCTGCEQLCVGILRFVGAPVIGATTIWSYYYATYLINSLTVVTSCGSTSGTPTFFVVKIRDRKLDVGTPEHGND